LFPISALKSLAIAIAMSVFFALILKIIYCVLLCTYFIPVALESHTINLFIETGGHGHNHYYIMNGGIQEFELSYMAETNCYKNYPSEYTDYFTVRQNH
ncbi:MAG: hypothetical protein WAT22_11905, partial [Saprospiraceae bacterium]